jgi:hypothetical protein
MTWSDYALFRAQSDEEIFNLQSEYLMLANFNPHFKFETEIK